jgi:predicted nucleotidyltransferase component of viral defense system
MLSLKYLLEEAESNGLPALKTRGILREYIQVIALNSLYKHPMGRKLYFTGGTALRFFSNMPRFSEDLDFDSGELQYGEFEDILECLRKNFIHEGISAEISKEQRDNLYVAEVRFRDIIRLYNISDARGFELMMKVEVFKPRWKLSSESAVLSLYGYNFSYLLLDKGYMFAEKICALLNRGRGRDVYDTLFMLKKRFPINQDVLAANKITGSPRELILTKLRGLPEKEVKFLAKQVRPFLFKEDDVELVLKAPAYAERFLEIYGQ